MLNVSFNFTITSIGKIMYKQNQQNSSNKMYYRFILVRIMPVKQLELTCNIETMVG